MPNHRWISAAAALLLCSAAGVIAETNGGRFIIDHFGEKEGLPQSSVIAMTQTRDGYLWLGTVQGLVRFDGLRFAVFDEINTPGLNSVGINRIFEDSHGNLWIGTESAGPALIQDGRLISLESGKRSRERRLLSVCEDSTGAVWLYTEDGLLLRHVEGNDRVWRVSGIRTMVAEKSGPIWVGQEDAQFALNPSANFTATDLPKGESLPSTRQLDFLLAGQKGGLWRLADGHIQKWTTNHLDLDLGPYPWNSSAPVSAACEDQDGNLVVGTYGDGVYWFDALGKFTRIGGARGLSHDSILSLVFDREGSLWVGTDGGGLNRVKRPLFDVQQDTEGKTVQSVSEDAGGGLWIGFNGGGPNGALNYWKNGERKQYGTNQDLYVRSVFVDRSQRVWVGTWGPWGQLGPGLFLFNAQSNGFQQALGVRTSAIYQDRQGAILAGTESFLGIVSDQGLGFLGPGTNGLSSGPVRALANDAEGNLWIGTEGGGLNCLRSNSVTSLHMEKGAQDEDITALRSDDEGVLWIGTQGRGLERLFHGKWTRYTTEEGLVGNSISYLLDDGTNLWLGSNVGLMRVPKKSLNDLAQGLTNSVPCRAYGLEDGLPTRECTFGSQPAAIRTHDGKLWFPTTKGLVYVDPARLVANTNVPPVVIESVLIDRRAQNTNGIRTAPPQLVTVPAGNEQLEIQYTSLDLASPERVRFKYWIDDYEKFPTIVGNNSRSATYIKLPHGNHRFHVTACNEDGIWNETGATLEIIVLPPFWQKWWFITGSIVCLLGLIVGSVHFVSTQRLLRQLALEKERARIARDIHDQLGASLTQVSLLGEMVESDKDSPSDVEAHAKQISQTARETSRALDEIVWTVNPSNDTLDGLVTYVCKFAQEYLAVAGLRYRLDVPTDLPGTIISPELRHNVFLAARESVTNIVKHAHASAAWVRLRLGPDSFTLEIEDNGRGVAGIDTPQAQSRNGLRNMRKRMEDVGGRFEIGPGSEGGTLVRLTVPIKNH